MEISLERRVVVRGTRRMGMWLVLFDHGEDAAAPDTARRNANAACHCIGRWSIGISLLGSVVAARHSQDLGPKRRARIVRVGLGYLVTDASARRAAGCRAATLSRMASGL